MAKPATVDPSGEPRPGGWRWLASTVDLQREAYGWDWEKIRAEDRYEDVLRQSVSENVTALVAELGEALGEVNFKRWATAGGFKSRDAFVEELVDVAHFLANLAVSAGCTDEEWERIYQAKQRTNRDRQAAGYDGVAGKCPRCRRSYDGAGVECLAGGVKEIYAPGNDEPVDQYKIRPFCAEVGHFV